MSFFRNALEARRPLRWFQAWHALGWLLIASVVYFSLTPAPPEMDIPSSDKWGHVAMYAVLMSYFVQLYERPAYPWLAVIFIAFGVSMECAQGLTPYRTFDYLDMLANATGVLLGWRLGYSGMVRILGRVESLLIR